MRGLALPGTITQRPLSTWVGSVNGGSWSNAANWDALPDGNNVAAVTIGSGSAAVVFDLAGTTSLQSINSAGGLTLAGGSIVTGSKKTQIKASVGVAGTRYTVTNRIVTSSSYTDDRSFVELDEQ